MNESERQEFFKFAKRLKREDWALPWADEFYISDLIEGIPESRKDIHFARELEEFGRTGLLAPKTDDIYYSVYFPLNVVVEYHYSISAEGIEKFLKGKLRFGDKDQIVLINAYSYLKLFEKYSPYISLFKRCCKSF